MRIWSFTLGCLLCLGTAIADPVPKQTPETPGTKSTSSGNGTRPTNKQPAAKGSSPTPSDTIVIPVQPVVDKPEPMQGTQASPAAPPTEASKATAGSEPSKIEGSTGRTTEGSVVEEQDGATTVQQGAEGAQKAEGPAAAQEKGRPLPKSRGDRKPGELFGPGVTEKDRPKWGQPDVKISMWKYFISMGLVLGLIVVFFAGLKKFSTKLSGQTTDSLAIRQRLQLDPKNALVLVRFHEEDILVSIGPNGTNLISRTSAIEDTMEAELETELEVEPSAQQVDERLQEVAARFVKSEPFVPRNKE